jgi:hypothetical protein
MTTSSLYPQKPGLLTTVAVMTMISGIINLFWGIVASLTALGTILGIVCVPLTILPTILGIVEIIYAVKLLNSQSQPVQPAQVIAILELLCFFIGNIFSMVVGILALVFYNDLAVKDYFGRVNASLPSADRAPVNLQIAVPPAPLPEPDLKPSPSDLQKPIESLTPEPQKKPAKPSSESKPRRKAAKK